MDLDNQAVNTSQWGKAHDILCSLYYHDYVSTPPFMENTMKDPRFNLQKWMWWTKGECVVEVLKTGHYPTTAMVRLPNDKETEIEIAELEYDNN